MKFSDIPRDPDDKTLRQFAGIWLLFFGFIACYSWYRGTETWPFIWLGVACLVGLPGLIFPKPLKWIFVTWMILAFPIGWTISHVLLFLVFCLVFTPLGLLLRLFGHDPLLLRKPDAESYWTKKTQQQDPRRYLKQF
jgi:hypothetical protein